MSVQVQNPLRLLRRKQVESRTGLSRSTIYARIAEGSFPRPIDLGGGRAVGWIEAEIDAWLQARIDSSRSRKSVYGR
jgi:prophage regulatory protein